MRLRLLREGASVVSSVLWENVGGKPSAFPPAPHEHAAPDRYAELTRGTSQSIQNDVWTPVAWTAETADPQGWHGETNPERIAPGAGVFLVSFHTPWAASTAGRRRQGVSTSAVAGLDENFTDPTLATNAPATHSYVLRCGPTDYITCNVRQNSGGPLDLLAAARAKVAKIG